MSTLTFKILSRLYPLEWKVLNQIRSDAIFLIGFERQNLIHLNTDERLTRLFL